MTMALGGQHKYAAAQVIAMKEITYCGQTRTLCTKNSKGLRCLCRKPFAFNQESVAGVRFELTTFGL
jgi:hypothetical protein